MDGRIVALLYASYRYGAEHNEATGHSNFASDAASGEYVGNL